MLRTSSVLLILTVASRARADDLDTQLYHPSFSTEGFLTHPGARLTDGPPRAGVLLQVEHEPLVTASGEDVIPARGTLHLGLHCPLLDAVALEAAIPLTLMAAPETVELPPFALGDLGAAVLWRWLSFEELAFAADLRLAVPIGTTGGLVGEGTFRGGPGVSLEGSLGPVSLLAATSLWLRMPAEIGRALRVGSELAVTLGVAWAPPDLPLRVVAELRGRRHLGNAPSLGANPMTVDASLHHKLNETITLTVGFGSALTNGYGAADFRGAMGIVIALERPQRMISTSPVPEQKRSLREILALPEELEPRSAPSTSTPSAAPAMADVLCPSVGPALHFEANSAALSATVSAQLDRVAATLRSDASVIHVLIEGYASGEGLASKNWQLSQRRAQSVFVYLVQTGVPPSMLSIRGGGERSPELRPRDRRVDICIVRTLGPFEDRPASASSGHLPWTEQNP